MTRSGLIGSVILFGLKSVPLGPAESVLTVVPSKER